MPKPAPAFIVFLFVLFFNQSEAQPCGCTECPLIVADLVTSMIPVEVSGVTNDDLSDPNQGVCGVRLEFTHEDVGDWTIDLISPSGQMVQLKGPFTLCGFSYDDVWRVGFVPCGQPANPDPGYSAVWDNCEFEDTNNLQFIGDYYPTLGCLEDFNAGPVNGTWIINSFDNREGQEGEFLNFELIFCDPDGIECETVVCQDYMEAIIAVTDTIFCDMDTVYLDGSASIGDDLTYSWTTDSGLILWGETDPVAAVGLPGIYVLEISRLGPEGVYCVERDSVEIEASTVPVPEATVVTPYTIDCDSPQIHIIATIEAGAGATFFEWTTADGNIVSGENTNTAVVDLAGTYNVFVFNEKGCGNNYEVTVLEDFEEPDFGILFDHLNCYNFLQTTLELTDLEIDQTFFWDGPDIGGQQTDQMPTVSLPGQYAVTVTNPNGCPADTTIEIEFDTTSPQVVIDVVPDDNCNSILQTLLVNTTDVLDSYQWTGPDITGLNEFSPIVQVISSGLYRVEVVAANGCTNFDTVLIDQLPPWPPDVIAPDRALTCDSSQVRIGPDFLPYPFEYLWTGPDIMPGQENNLNQDVTLPGLYVLEIRDDRNCVAFESIMVTVDTMEPVFDTLAYSFGCDDEFTEIGVIPANNDVSVLWTGPDVTPLVESDLTIIVRTLGSYEVQLLGANGCLSYKTFDVEKLGDIPDLFVITDTISCSESEATLSAFSSSNVDFLWSGPDVNAFNETDPIITVSIAGSYGVVITDEFGCKNGATVFVPADTASPSILVLEGDSINCTQSAVELNVESDFNVTYLWSGPDISSANETLQNPTVTSGGTYQIEITSENGCTTTDSISIFEFVDIPQLTLMSDIITCELDSVVINLNAPEAESVVWTGPGINFLNENEEDPEINIPGFYEVEIVASNGCKNQATILIEIDTVSPSLMLSADVLTCVQNMTTISNVSNALTFLWAGPDIDASNEAMEEPEVELAGTYEVEAIGENGCPSVSTIEVGIDTLSPTASINPAILTCTESAVMLEMNSDATDITWVGPDINASNVNVFNPEVSLPGSYTATLEGDNGCETEIDVEVDIDTLSPTATILSSALILTCSERQIRLDGTTSTGQGSIEYTWSRIGGGGINPAEINSAEVNIQMPGTYELKVIDQANGCEGFSTIEITQDGNLPFIILDEILEITCVRDRVTIDATNSIGVDLGFSWSGAGITGPMDEASITALSPGLYYLTMTDLSNDCAIDTVIEVMQNITEPVFELNVDAALSCLSDMVEIGFNSSNPNISVSWSGPGITGANMNVEQPIVDQEGQYEVTVTDDVNRCMASKTIDVERTIAPTVLNLNIIEPNCIDRNGGSIEIVNIPNATEPITYFFNDENIDGPYTNLGDGVYVLKIEDGNGCVVEETVQFSVPDDLFVDLGNDIFISLGETVQLSPNINRQVEDVEDFVWLTNLPINCDSCFEIEFQPLQSSQIELQISDRFGCTEFDDIQVFVSENKLIFIPTGFSPNNDRINDVFEPYPGPAVNRILDLFIYNRWGSLVFNWNEDTSRPLEGWDGTFNGQDLDPGVFVYHTTFELINGKVRTQTGQISLLR